MIVSGPKVLWNVIDAGEVRSRLLNVVTRFDYNPRGVPPGSILNLRPHYLITANALT